MNKKLLAVAVAAALAAPLAANADSGNVTISGNLNMSLDSLNNGDQRNTNVSSNSSYIRFAGDESLGNGLKAIWQLTSYVGMGDTSSRNASNTLTNGNSFVGLTGGFGTALLGKHDTPVKILGRKADLFGDQVGDSRNLISVGGAGWDLRPDNVIAYISPTISGIHGAIAYVTNVGANAAADAGCGSTSCVDAWSGLAIYEGGPAMVGIGYEKHNLSKVANTGNDEKAWRLVGGYSFGDVKVTALYQKVNDIGGTSDSRKTWSVGGAYKMGATTLKAQYINAGDVSNTSNTGANLWALGADYALSKRTTAYAAYARTNNDDAANFMAYSGGHGDAPAVAVNKDPSGLSFGVKHAF